MLQIWWTPLYTIRSVRSISMHGSNICVGVCFSSCVDSRDEVNGCQDPWSVLVTSNIYILDDQIWYQKIVQYAFANDTSLPWYVLSFYRITITITIITTSSRMINYPQVWCCGKFITQLHTTLFLLQMTANHQNANLVRFGGCTFRDWIEKKMRSIEWIEYRNDDRHSSSI